MYKKGRAGQVRAKSNVAKVDIVVDYGKGRGRGRLEKGRGSRKIKGGRKNLQKGEQEAKFHG